MERGEKTERETVAAERVNTNAARGEAPGEGRRQGGTRGGAFFRLRGGHMVLIFFGHHNVTASALKTAIAHRLANRWGRHFALCRHALLTSSLLYLSGAPLL